MSQGIKLDLSGQPKTEVDQKLFYSHFHSHFYLKEPWFALFKGVAGVEPDGESASCPVSICDSVVLSEALTEILTEISDRDRQILVTVVNRWKRLSEELKQVVLAVTDIA